MTLLATETLASVEFADAYALGRNWPEAAWSDKDIEIKEAKLREATDFILGIWRWPSSALYADTPPTAWPYMGANVDGRWYYGVPTLLQNAAVETARLAVAGPLVGGEQTRLVRRKKIGSLEKEFEPADRTRDQSDKFAFIASLLARTGATGGFGNVNVPLRRA